MKVSVLIPVFNVEKYISRCLDSVLMQTMQDFEVIAVDDCGSDGSVAILEEYAAKDNRIRLLHHDHNRGLMLARKTAYLEAKGDYIVFLDSDDYLPADALNKMVDGIERSSSDIFMGAFKLVYKGGVSAAVNNEICGEFVSQDILRMLFANKVSHSLCGKIFKRKLFLESTKLPAYEHQTNSEDLMLFYTLVGTLDVRMTISNECVYIYYQNDSSSSKQKYSDKHFRQIILATEYIVELFKDNQNLSNNLERYVKKKAIICNVSRV